MLSVPIFDMSQGLAEKAIYSHTQQTTGTYTFMWNAIHNAENIFSSPQQTAKGTSGSSPVKEQLFLAPYGLSITVIQRITPSRTSLTRFRCIKSDT